MFYCDVLRKAIIMAKSIFFVFDIIKLLNILRYRPSILFYHLKQNNNKKYSEKNSWETSAYLCPRICAGQRKQAHLQNTDLRTV